MCEVMVLGVLGRIEGYEQVTFRVNGHECKTRFATEALRRFYESNNRRVKVLLFVPRSLLEDCGVDCLRSKVEKGGHGGFEIVEVPGVGGWTRINEVSAFMLLTMLEKERPSCVVVNISTGQNVYVIALLDAVRRYATFRQLEEILQKPKLEVKVASHQPITKEVKEANIELYPLQVRAFFSLPEPDIDKLYELDKNDEEDKKKRIGEIGKKYKEKKERFRKIKEKLKIAFNAIRYNIPLAFYEDELLKVIEEKEVDCLAEKLVKYGMELLSEEIKVNLVNLSNVFFALAMFKSFNKFRNTLSEPSIDEIQLKFPEVYESLGIGVNSYFLHNDLEIIKKAVEEKKKPGKVALSDLLGRGMSSDLKRNFFAHSGFLKEYTEVEVKDGKVILSWNKEHLEEIKKWLREPEYKR